MQEFPNNGTSPVSEFFRNFVLFSTGRFYIKMSGSYIKMSGTKENTVSLSLVKKNVHDSCSCDLNLAPNLILNFACESVNIVV